MARKGADLLADLDKLGEDDSFDANNTTTANASLDDDLDLSDLQAQLAAKPAAQATTASRPNTPRLSSSTTSAGTSKKAEHTPASSGQNSGRNSTEDRTGKSSERAFHTGVTPGDGIQDEMSFAASSETSTTGAGWWGSLISSASATATAAIKQAEVLTKDLRNNEEAAKWAEQVRQIGGKNLSNLQGLTSDLRSRALPTFTSLLQHIAPPISAHERLQIHITHDILGYPSLDPLIYRTFERTMAQVEGGELLVIQRGSESKAKGDGEKGYRGGILGSSGGWSDGPWWRDESTKRSLGTVPGIKEGTRLARVSAEAYSREHFESHGGVEEAAKRATETLSETNPTRSSDIFLAIQAVSYVQDKELFAADARAETSTAVAEPEETSESIVFAIYLHDPIHSITFSTLSQSFPLQWSEWLDAGNESGEAADLPESIRHIIEAGGVDPREWVAEWMEEVLVLAVGVLAQRYVAKRMGVGEAGLGRGKKRVEESSLSGEAARAISLNQSAFSSQRIICLTRPLQHACCMMSLGLGYQAWDLDRHARQPAWLGTDKSLTVSRTEVLKPHNSMPDAIATATTTTPQRRVKAHYDGSVLIFTGLDPVVQREWSTKAARKADNTSLIPTIAAPQGTDDDMANGRRSHLDEEGPNERGTYSKEYTLRHPEITWVHRGQGRYLPESQVSATNERREALTSSQTSLPSEGRPSRSVTRRRFSYSSDESDDHKPRSRSRHFSPRATRQSESTYSLRRRGSHSNIRTSRRIIGDYDDSQGHEVVDTAKTYIKSYVEAHPEIAFKHVGAGFYRRVSTKASHDEDSTADNTETIAVSSFDQHTTANGRHAGNGQYRRVPSSADTSTKSSQDNTQASASTEEPTSAEMNNDSFTKEQMLRYKQDHPNVIFIHRGNGRYKRITDVGMDANSTQDDMTYDKAWVDSHPGEVFHHCGFGRYKRGVKPSRNSFVESEDGEENLLVTRDYVEQHPELTFHHRGQGRYALGPRTRTSATITPSQSFTSLAKTNEVLYDKDYVESHPDETFHHRGQGRWARGLPPPGSSNKMAVRGPGASQLVRTSTTSSGATDGPAYNEADLPGLNELVRRDGGPDKFPDIHWHYRGGGKWARISKDEAESAERAARAGRAKPKQAALSELVGQTLQAPTLKRKHSQLQSEEQGFDSAQQSGTSTPRPRILTLEEDLLTEADLLPYERREWTPLQDDELEDEAAQVLQQKYAPLTHAEDHISVVNKFDIAIRPTQNLYLLAEHLQSILRQYQDEYLELDKITAPHARIPRKVATGGRLPADHLVFEDRKEADLYDYTFDAKRIGFQDPEAQKITRDGDGRELRKRRRRGEVELDASVMDDVSLPRRTIKPVTRFDGVPGSTTRRSRLADASKQDSVTPDRVMTPEKIRATADTYVAPTSGRWAGHVPKRIRELRGGNVLRQDVSDDEEDDDEDEDEEDETELLTTRGTRSRPAVSSPAKGTPTRGVMDSIEYGSQSSGSLLDTRL